MHEVAAPDRQHLHRHDNARLIVFTGGELAEDSFAGAARFGRGDFVFRPPWYAHADRVSMPGARYVRLPLSDAAVRSWLAQKGWRAARGRVDLEQPLHGDEALADASDAPYAHAADASPLHMASRMLASADAPRVADLAARLDFEPYAFCRRFKASFGLSPAVYRRQARLERALRMLFEGAESLAGIASEAGYHDQSHFTAELKRETGRTPRQLAAEHAR